MTAKVKLQISSYFLLNFVQLLEKFVQIFVQIERVCNVRVGHDLLELIGVYVKRGCCCDRNS